MAEAGIYRQDQIARVVPHFEGYIYDSNESKNIENLGISPEVYFASINAFFRNFEIVDPEFFPFLAPEPEASVHRYAQYINDGYTRVTDVDGVLVYVAENYESCFCPLCIIEADPNGTVEDPTTTVPFISSDVYLIHCPNRDIELSTSTLGIHLATTHNCSAGLNVHDMASVLRLI